MDDLQELLDNSASKYETLYFYDGTEVIHYDDAIHAYFKTDEDGNKILVAGVTTVTGMIDKSGPLTQWAANMTVKYLRESFGQKGVYDTGEALLYRVTPEDFEKLLEEARFNFRKVKEDASDVGTQAHDWLEQYIKGLIAAKDGVPWDVSTLPMPSDPRSVSCVQAALRWMQQHHFDPLFSERKIYSRTHNYSGTLDTIAYITACGNPKCCNVEGRKLALCDFKSSNRLYEEYALQTAAYELAHEEEFPEQQMDLRILLRLGKEDGEFEAKPLLRDRLDHDIEGFLHALGMYAWKRQLELDAKYEKDLVKAEKKAAKAAALAANPKPTKRRSKPIKVKEPDFEPIPIGA